MGPLVLSDADGVPVSATRRKELALLAYLARREGRPIRRDELLDLMWGDRPEENARLSLRQALLRLRRLAGEAIAATPETVTLAREAIALDLAQFEQEVGAGRHAEATARWRGEFLAAADDAGGERYRAWIHAERAAARRLLAIAFEQLIIEASGRGAWDEVIAHAERWSAADHAEVRAHVALIDALLVRGRLAEAASRHATFVSQVDGDLPRDIVKLGDRLTRAERNAPRPPNPGIAGLFSPDMVGRERAHAEVVAAWRHAREGRATTVVVEGEVGIGKSRLVDEFLRGLRAERRAVFVLRSRSAAGTAEPLTVMRELLAPLERAPGLAGAAPGELAALAALVPAVRDRFPHVEDRMAGAADAAAIAGIVAAVAAEVPVVVFVDDVGSIDAASRALLLGVLRRLDDAPVLTVMASSTGELSGDDLRDIDARAIRLSPLDAAGVDRLVASMVQMDERERLEMAARLERERGGNPFDVIETLVLLVEEGQLAPDAGGTWRLDPALGDRALPVPGTVREAIVRRIGTLSPDARRALAAAARLEDGFTVEALARASRSGTAVVVDALDQLVARRLVRPGTGRGTFEIAHHAVRAAALRASLHGRSPVAARWRWAAAASLALVAAAGVALAVRQGPAFARTDVPLVAIAAAWETSGDTAAAWLAHGVPRIMESKLGRSSELDVIPAGRVEAVRARAQIGPNRPVGVDAAIDVGRRVGASWVLSAAVTSADAGVTLELSVHDVARGRLLRRAVLRGTDVFAVADAAVAQVLALAGVGRSGPRFADLETSSTAAFEQYVRAIRAQAEGRGTAEVSALDAAIALDSSFGSALLLRAGIAREHGDTAMLRRLSARLDRARDRLSTRDRLHWDAASALHVGDADGAERAARELIARYPRDPRGSDVLADLYFVTGRWEEMKALLRETLALDSLGIAAGTGPCIPCVTYGRLVEVEWMLGQRDAAEVVARRWVQVQPASANAHHHLAKVLARRQRSDEAVLLMRRAVSLSGNDPVQQLSLARVLLLTRRHAAVDSLLAVWARSTSPELGAAAVDIRSLRALERGALRTGIRDIEAALAEDPRRRWLELILATYHGRLGDVTAATRILEHHGHTTPGPVRLPLDFAEARNFAWSHAVLADALASRGDTARLRALADSIEQVARYSLFSRDWKLHHHVRGLIAMRAGRYADAERQFAAARWGASGWTRTLAWLARAQLAQGRSRDAVQTLRGAYEWPDAMGRYQAVRETDSLMAVAFRSIGARDSAARYERYVRSAVQGTTADADR